jgi:hypothetical protein
MRYYAVKTIVMKPTNHVLMVRPATFCANKQTVATNFFQRTLPIDSSEACVRAQSEFDQLVAELRQNGVRVSVYQDTFEPLTPDAVFPNNWFVSLPQQRFATFPMLASNRRLERSKAVLTFLENEGVVLKSMLDYTTYEEQNQFLEGTGSMVLDLPNRLAYCALSPRANKSLFEQFCADHGFTPICFHAYQTVANKRLPIYHTNVLMAVAPIFAVICLDAIDDAIERETIINSLQSCKKHIINISEAQLSQFVGNMLALTAADGTPLMAMSTQAHTALSRDQLTQLCQYAKPVFSPIPTIETLGGGGVRCMLAELF